MSNKKYDYNIPKEKLEQLTKISFSLAQLCRHLNFPPGNRCYAGVKHRLTELEIDYSHFTGQRWVTSENCRNTKPLETFLTSTKPCTNTHKLKLRLYKAKLLEAKCKICGISNWLNKPLSLELNHIDGDRTNNKLENFEILCPNCHAQTYNYKAKNKRSYQEKQKKLVFT